MGYRSNVAIKCEKKAYEELLKVFEGQELTPDQILTNGSEYCIKFDWVKWYEDYPDVQAVMSKLSEFNDKEDSDGFGYAFARIGEDNEDIERQSNTRRLYIGIETVFVDEGDFEPVEELDDEPTERI